MANMMIHWTTQLCCDLDIIRIMQQKVGAGGGGVALFFLFFFFLNFEANVVSAHLLPIFPEGYVRF